MKTRTARCSCGTDDLLRSRISTPHGPFQTSLRPAAILHGEKENLACGHIQHLPPVPVVPLFGQQKRRHGLTPGVGSLGFLAARRVPPLAFVEITGSLPPLLKPEKLLLQGRLLKRPALQQAAAEHAERLLPAVVWPKPFCGGLTALTQPGITPFRRTRCWGRGRGRAFGNPSHGVLRARLR